MSSFQFSGTGGRLLPFFKAVLLYFVGTGEASVSTAALKCLPILCLAAFLVWPRITANNHARNVFAGLLLSAIGDCCLVWEGYFPAGMLAFAIAHVFYVRAFGTRPRRWDICAALVAAVAVSLMVLRPPAGVISTLLPLYSLALAGTCWRAMARVCPRKCLHCNAGALGALLFMLSDSVLAYDTFNAPLPHAKLMVMTTYYLAQLGIALTVLTTHTN